MHERVSRGSGKDGDGKGDVGSGSLKAFIVTEINIGALRRVFLRGGLCEIGKGQRPITEIEREPATVKRELSLARMERDILKNCPKGVRLFL